MPVALAQAFEGKLSTVSIADVGAMALYEGGVDRGRPLVLIHSINAAPSAMEVKPLFEAFCNDRPVYAPDLPGFGLSPRMARRYDTALFTQAICGLLHHLSNHHALAPDIVALSLSGEFIARAIVEHGVPCHRLVLISPTGLSRRTPPAPGSFDWVKRLPGSAFLGRSLFKLLTSRRSVSYFLNKAFTLTAPTELIEYALQTTRVKGAEYAPLSFLSMGLFSPNALDNLYAQLKLPTLLIYDTDPNVDFDRLPELISCNSWVRAERITPTRGLPHWEKPRETQTAIAEFLATP